jgi:hypothetical protein
MMRGRQAARHTRHAARRLQAANRLPKQNCFNETGRLLGLPYRTRRSQLRHHICVGAAKMSFSSTAICFIDLNWSYVGCAAAKPCHIRPSTYWQWECHSQVSEPPPAAPWKLPVELTELVVHSLMSTGCKPFQSGVPEAHVQVLAWALASLAPYIGPGPQTGLVQLAVP